ncbi:DNA alkylation repair protein [Achromobacter sp. Marseille-Q0513]|uniref:DNA alkylation repair protein n=1 Tax=Achromobacter sp. Marseille-Q0513 TaxID=2829161 RepID=UPI0020127FCF|nr:DNA alkylation repair protein [Achromobacter sp. Marseille-Q0513]
MSRTVSKAATAGARVPVARTRKTTAGAGKAAPRGKASAAGRGVQDISPARRAQLDAGAPASNLTECLAVDFAALMAAAVPQAGADAAEALRAAAGQGISRRMALAGAMLLERLGPAGFESLREHASDTVRGWACFMAGAMPGLELEARLRLIRPLADDAHFGVREWVWMALRPGLAAELRRSVALLTPWTKEPSERLRRFASESLRPRGVWCAHIAELKADPDIGLPLLTPLRADPSVYVQDSVANWLNDASKDQPDWVRGVCARWQADAPAEATLRICRRALRTVGA